MTGTLIYEAQKVGAESFANRLTAQAKAATSMKTPLQKEIDFLVRLMLFVVVPLGGTIIVTLVIKDVPVVEGVKIAAVVVSLLPQGLFFMTTVSYSMGVVRVSGKKALVQQINAVESISHVNVLCLDKTGTLTTNRIQLDSVIPVGQEAGNSPDELMRVIGDYAASSSDHNRTMDALEKACPGEQRELLEQVAFSAVRKWSALQWGRGTYVLGAPEVLQRFLPETGPESAGLFEQVDRLAESGARVLLFAELPAGASIRDSAGNPRLTAGIKPLALLTFAEELREDAPEIIGHFKDLGIELKVISGDHPETVAALCRRAGLGDNLRVMSGLDLDEDDDARMDEAVASVTVFGRITPSQKEKLVRAIQRGGSYVAMIGDGVNDVLALKQAQVGVAMQSGSQATGAVADLVLLDDSFAALPAAFREGQRIIKGMEDVVRLLLVRSFYLALAIMLTQILGLEFPVTPKHNALLALLTVGVPILAIAAWARPGKPAPSLVKAIASFVSLPAITISVVVLGVYFFYLETTDDVEIARTALITVAVLIGLVLIPFVEPPTKWWVGGDVLSGDWRPTMLAAAMLLVFVVILAVPPLRDFAELRLLGWEDYLAIVGLVVLWTVVQRWLWRTGRFQRILRPRT